MMRETNYGAALPHNAGVTFQGASPVTFQGFGQPQVIDEELIMDPAQFPAGSIPEAPKTLLVRASLKQLEDGTGGLFLQPARFDQSFAGRIAIPVAAGIVGILLGKFVFGR